MSTDLSYVVAGYSHRCLYVLCRHSAADLSGKRAVLFSYGSGLAASMFSVRFSDNASPDSALHRLSVSLADLQARLDSRQKVDPAIFSKTMKLREDTHHLGKNVCLFDRTGYEELIIVVLIQKPFKSKQAPINRLQF